MKSLIIASVLSVVLLAATNTDASAHWRRGYCRPVVRVWAPVRVYAPPVVYYNGPAYYPPARCQAPVYYAPRAYCRPHYYHRYWR